MTHQTLPRSPFFRVWEVAAYLGCGVSTVWRWARTRSDFPRPEKMGDGFTVWRREEVEAFVLKKKRRVA